ncbi:CXXC-type zinc finger protein 1 [Desmophyllum pertusum]|uniref:CXXC-type zinc finger protein 1 n=1 Tax=Desmophyllum pertusum TaxID=174260 RepID=A0A9W9YWP1_9CNID|nr:CXXC-type zinc finger protein 1 [Desmophyllum pertusum]
MSTEYVDERERDEAPRQCYGPGCTNAARSLSKYCSDECGIQLAVRKLRRSCWNLTDSATKLDAFIEKSKNATVEEAEAQDTEIEGETDLQIHCITCGLPLAPKVALRHMEKCYMKNESLTTFGSIYKSAGNLFCDYYNSQQKIYCKRLRVLCPEHTKEPKISAKDVCGCPLVTDVFDESGDFCRAAKRTCLKHYCWEKLRRAGIDLQRIQQWLKLEEAYEQERSLSFAAARRGGVLGLLLHTTVCHE